MALLIDPEQMALYGPFIAGGFGVFGTLLGVALGLFGERWVRTRGKVRCDIRWWASLRKELVDAPGGLEVTERRLETTFLNRKDVPVTVWEMGVTFYKGGKPLDAQERPRVEFLTSRGAKRPRFEQATLPPRIPVSLTVNVSAKRAEPHRKKAAEEADRIEFVAVIEGAKDKGARLVRWNEPEDQKERC